MGRTGKEKFKAVYSIYFILRGYDSFYIIDGS